MILVAALAAVSCENTVDKIWSDDNEAMLVLNAQLRQDERIHRVFVDCSQGAKATMFRMLPWSAASTAQRRKSTRRKRPEP